MNYLFAKLQVDYLFTWVTGRLSILHGLQVDYLFTWVTGGLSF